MYKSSKWENRSAKPEGMGQGTNNPKSLLLTEQIPAKRNSKRHPIPVDAKAGAMDLLSLNRTGNIYEL